MPTSPCSTASHRPRPSQGHYNRYPSARGTHRDLIEGRDFDYSTTVGEKASDVQVPCEPGRRDRIRFMYFTPSGTTGQPKGVVRDNGGHMVALKWSMQNLYGGIEPGEVFWQRPMSAGSLAIPILSMAPCSMAAPPFFSKVFAGTPDAGTFRRVISEHGVAALFTAPTAFRAIKKEDPKGEFAGKHDMTTLRTLFLAGER
ncbi:MAG: AMP-binding protein [Nitratireductor sp.]